MAGDGAISAARVALVILCYRPYADADADVLCLLHIFFFLIFSPLIILATFHTPLLFHAAAMLRAFRFRCRAAVT